MGNIINRFGYDEVINFNCDEYEKVYKDKRVIEFTMPDYSEIDPVLYQIQYYYTKFQNGDCDPNYKEFRKLIDELNAICEIRDRLHRLYDDHHVRPDAGT